MEEESETWVDVYGLPSIYVMALQSYASIIHCTSVNYILLVYYLYILGISINQYLMIPIELVYLSIIHKVHKLGYGFPMSLYFRKVHLPLHIPTLFIGQK